MKSNVEYWNKDAVNYDNRAKRSHKAYQIIIDLIKREVKNDMSVLDIGTGTGEIPINICKEARNIEGIDYSIEMINIAKRKTESLEITNVVFSVQNSTNLNYENGSFDIIIISNLLHIVEEPEKIINEAKRLLKNEGKIIIANYLHNANIRSRLISFIMGMKGHPVTSKYNHKTLCKFIEGCSLKITYKNRIPNIMPLLYLVATK
jgi:ubiquinone/menaquinone biosynthesis C-methylase UbiE